MSHFIRTLIVCFLFCGLTGCAILDPGPPMSQVILPVRLPVAAEADRLPVQLLVVHPVTDTATGTDRIMALMNGYEVRALDESKWVSPVPAMVQRLLIDSLEASRRLDAVGREDSGMDTFIRLATDIRRFYLRYENPGSPPVVDIVIVMALADTKEGKIFARKMIAVEQPCSENSVREFVAAFSLAMNKVLNQSDEWILASIATHIGQ